jgi:hypothetical protein
MKEKSTMKKQFKFLAIIFGAMLGQVCGVSPLIDVNDNLPVTTPLTLQNNRAYRVGAGSGNVMVSVLLGDNINANYGASSAAVTGGSTITTLTAGKGNLTISGGEYAFTITNLVKSAPGKLSIVMEHAVGLTIVNTPIFSNGASYADFIFKLRSPGGTLTLPAGWGDQTILDSDVPGCVAVLAGITTMPILKGVIGTKLTLPAAITSGTKKKINFMSGKLVTTAPITLD